MSSPAFRQTLGLLALSMALPMTTLAEPLGRLFFSPAQRSALDQQAQTEPSPAEQGNATRFDGMVLRSNGRSTYWIGGKPRNSTEALPARLRVGESVDPTNGDRRALLGDNALRIRRHQRQ